MMTERNDKKKDDGESPDLKEKVSDMNERLESFIRRKPFLSSWDSRVKRLMALKLGQTAAASSFYFLFSLFPMLLLFFALLNVINPDLAVRVEQALPSMSVAIPEVVLEILLDFIKGISKSAGVPLISVTAVGLLWSAAKGVGIIVNFMNNIYHARKKLNFLLRRLFGVVSILGLAFFLLAIMFILSFNQVIVSYLEQFIQLPSFLMLPNFNITAHLIAFGVLTAILTTIFSILGRRRGYFIHTLLSAMITSVAWLMLSFAFSTYMTRRKDYYVTYGSVTGIIFLMLYLYAAIYLIMVGGFIHTEFILKYPRKKRPDEEDTDEDEEDDADEADRTQKLPGCQADEKTPVK